MKKYSHLVISILFLTFIIPGVALASWWNPFSWFNSWGTNNQPDKTEILEKKVQELEAKLASTTNSNKSEQKITEQKTPALREVTTTSNPSQTDVVTKPKEVTATPITQPQVVITPLVQTPTIITPVAQTPTTDYQSYSVLPNDFFKNPPYYIGTRIKISGTIIGFMAQGDKATNSNYIEIRPFDSQDNTLPYVMLQINSNDNYQRAAVSLNKGDTLTAYGTVLNSQSFSNSFGIVSIIPVFDTVRLDKCAASTCTLNIGNQTIFPYVPIQNIINNNYVSITSIWKNSSLYINHVITTKGKIYQILNSISGGSSLLLMQDPDRSSGFVSVEVNYSFMNMNNIKTGDVLQISGTLLGRGDDITRGIYNKYQLADGSISYYIDSGTVTLINN